MAGSGFLIASAHVDIAADTRDALDNISGLITKLVAVGPAAGGVATVVAGALGSITAGAVAAGAAAGAFGLAVKPQFEAAKTAAEQYAAAQHAAAVGSADAAEKQKKFEETLKGMPPATQATAIALGKLKYGWKQWSDSLASTTMPVVTKGIELMGIGMHQLTPLVKTASGVFGDMMDKLKAGMASGGWKSFMAGLNETAKKTLPDFLNTFGQVFRGIGGIFQAFFPHADKFTTKMSDMATGFGNWGQSLSTSQGFKNFMTFVSENGPKVASTLGSLAEIAVKLWQAFAPLASIQLTFLAALADLVSKLPPPVILGLAAAFVALKIALLGFRIASMLTGTAMWPLITATWAWTAALLANPITWIILAIVALVAAIVLIATKTDWFQRLWAAAWPAIKAAWDATWNALKAGWNAMGNFFTQTIPGWLTSVKNFFTNKWNEIKTNTSNMLTAIKATFVNVWNSIISWVSSKVSSLVNTVKSGWNNAKSFVSSIGSAIVSLVRNAFSSMVSAVRDRISSAVSTVRGFKSSVVSFFSGAGSWLVSAGRRIIQGLVNGIKGMVGQVKNAVSNVMSAARNLLPFSPAKEGPFSGKGWTEYSGASLMQGLATGIDNSASLPRQSMSSALSGVSAGAGLQPVQGSGGSLHIESLTLNLDGKWDLTKPDQNRAAARLLAKNLSTELRNYEKERR
ncbi:phage tail protein [Streptomyces sp. NPDC055013]